MTAADKLKACHEQTSCPQHKPEYTLHNLISQYENSPKLQAYVRSFVDRVRQAIDELDKLVDVLSIDCAKGEHLDMLGRILGQERVFYDPALVPWFQFEDGTVQVLPNGFDHGKFWDGTTALHGGLIQIDDFIYRMFLKARAKKNNTHSTVEDMYEILKIITCRDDIQINAGNGQLFRGFTFYDEPNPKTAGLNIGVWGSTQKGYTVEPMKYELLLHELAPLDTTLKLFMLKYGLLPTPVGVKLTGIEHN